MIYSEQYFTPIFTKIRELDTRKNQRALGLHTKK